MIRVKFVKMTQTEFRNWLDGVIGNTPMDELIESEILENVNRLQVMGEDSAWGFAREEAREPFEIAIRAMCKTLFIVGYHSGREQSKIDNLFGDGSGFNFGDDQDAAPAV